MSQLVLSLFPGLDLLGMGFEAEGFCVVKGPDPVWASGYEGDVRGFHPPEGKFQGVIGGPPCQIHSEMRFLNIYSGQGIGDMVPEFCRVVGEAQPEWWVMENVPAATEPVVVGYRVTKVPVSNLDIPLAVNGFIGQEARRRRCFWFGSRRWEHPRFFVERSPLRVPRDQIKTAVLAGHGPAIGQRRSGIMTLPLEEAARLQGLDPEKLPGLPYTKERLRKLIGNGVPVPMARAVARGVIRATVG